MEEKVKQEEKGQNLVADSEQGVLEGTETSKKSRGKRRGWLILLAVLASLAVILFALYQIPAIHDRVYFYVTSARSKIFYSLTSGSIRD